MPRHLVMVAAVFVALVMTTSATFSWISVQFRLPLVQDLIASLLHHETQKTQEVVNNNLQLMATRLGELQAQVLQLDSLGERLSNLAGIKRESEGAKTEKPKGGGQGGPLIVDHSQTTYRDLQREIDRLTRSVEIKADELAMLESQLLEKKIRERLLPTTSPVKGAAIGSSFGFRNDPIAGMRAMHEGIDFIAEAGTPIVAAAAGLVLMAEHHYEFGNVVDIDHGDGLVSRYAHMSRIDVKPGRMVRRGERIGLVGSTGRSTGPHLHFEVRMNGAAQNPAVFLRQGKEFANLRTR